jgi:hypothetical protein
MNLISFLHAILRKILEQRFKNIRKKLIIILITVIQLLNSIFTENVI